MPAFQYTGQSGIPPKYQTMRPLINKPLLHSALNSANALAARLMDLPPHNSVELVWAPRSYCNSNEQINHTVFPDNLDFYTTLSIYGEGRGNRAIRLKRTNEQTN